MSFVPECNAAIHKKCFEKIIYNCTGTAANSVDTMVSAVNVLLQNVNIGSGNDSETLINIFLFFFFFFFMLWFQQWFENDSSSALFVTPIKIRVFNFDFLPTTSWRVLISVHAVPERTFQRQHAAPLQVLQLQEPHVLWPLRQSPVGSGETGPEMRRWIPQSAFCFFICIHLSSNSAVVLTSSLLLHASPSVQRVTWTSTVTARWKWPICVESTRNCSQKFCPSLPRWVESWALHSIGFEIQVEAHPK